MSRAIFLGDVHGCLDELDELLAVLELRAGDRLFFVGDLVDRGPDSVGVVRRARELLARFPGSAVVCGNHEEKVLRTRDRGKGPLPDWATDATDEDWAFLDGLPLVVPVPEVRAVVVHGGFFPRFFEKEGAVGAIGPGWRKDRCKRADRARRFLRVRRVNEMGEMIALGQERPHDPHWSSLYDGREGHVFFGHDPQLAPPAPLRAPHASGLDTGCCFGGRLTAAVVVAGQAPGEAQVVSVAARARYAEPRLAATEGA
jgi:hypothetical protein